MVWQETLFFILATLSAAALIFLTAKSVINERRLPQHKANYKAVFVRALLRYAVFTVALSVILYLLTSNSPPTRGGRPGLVAMFGFLSIFSAPITALAFFVPYLITGISKYKNDISKSDVNAFSFNRENLYSVIRGNEKTTICLLAWTARPNVTNGILRASQGRIIEISRDKVLVSKFHKISRTGRHLDAFNAWYQSEEWLTGAETYEISKVESIRLISERRYKGIQSKEVPPFHIIVMDYERHHVELNFSTIGMKEVGNASEEQEYILRFQKFLADEIKNRFAEKVDEEVDFEVTYEGVSEEESSKIKAEVERHAKRVAEHKKASATSTPDDPF